MDTTTIIAAISRPNIRPISDKTNEPFPNYMFDVQTELVEDIRGTRAIELSFYDDRLECTTCLYLNAITFWFWILTLGKNKTYYNTSDHVGEHVQKEFEVNEMEDFLQQHLSAALVWEFIQSKNKSSIYKIS